MTEDPHKESGTAILRECISSAAFWPPDRIGPQDSWLGHAPFAFWLLETLRPRTLVELGTHGGFSYFAFCQAVQRLRLETRCYAVDTWRGDEHAGFYGEDVFEELRRYHDRRYAAFSTLLRATFDDAVRHFQDGTIDLLHIDGRHFYDDVRHDFLTWRPRLSERGIVLFHDTNVRERDFGVARLWDELRREHPHFEFLHGHGLGVLGVGDRLPHQLGALFDAAGDAGAVAHIRSAYSRLGFAVSQELNVQQRSVELQKSKVEAETARGGLVRLQSEFDARSAEIARLGTELMVSRRRMADAQSELEARSEEAHRRIAELGAEADVWRRQAQVMRTSISWRLTEPLRRVADLGRRTVSLLRRGAAATGSERPEREPEFEGDFLGPYFRSVGFYDPPATVCLRLREAGWPVYRTREEAESTATLIRKSDMFHEPAYAARLGAVEGIDPALHYVIVGEGLGWMPSNRFDPTYYGQRYPDVTQVAINRLVHYLSWGRGEGRRPLSIAAGLVFDRSRIDPGRDTILVIAHEASRTGAPILAFNITRRLRRTYNVVAVLLAGGELLPQFEASCAAAVGSLTRVDWDPLEAKYLVQQLSASYGPRAAIVNSIESRRLLPALTWSGVPTVTLVHEFASYTRPEGTMGKALDWSTQVVFSAELVARAAHLEHPTLTGRPIHVLRQGRCDVPPRASGGPSAPEARHLEDVFQRLAAENAFVVLGCGTVHLRKGVDLFLSCAAAVAALGTKRPVRFVWIGHGYDPRQDASYSCYLADQIARAGLEHIVTMLDEVADLEPAYRRTDVFFLSSRLDPLPNVAIDAALRGIPIICFAGATGMAEVLEADPLTSRSVVPHLDAAAAARVIAGFADDKASRDETGAAIRRLAETTFDMDRYVNELDELGSDAVRIMRQRAQDFETIRNDALFDERVYPEPSDPPMTRDEAIVGFLARWTAVGVSRRPTANPAFRRPCPGFHPQIYAHENSRRYDSARVNPFADFLRRGKPNGPWRPELITPPTTPDASAKGPTLRTALHVHFYYPELADDFMRKLASNGRPCDLLLSTDNSAKADALLSATAGYRRGEVLIRVVPNRGRDLGPLLTGFAEEVSRSYDLVGHLHGKRTLQIDDGRLGDRWREFLWQHLVGDRHPMMDIIDDRFATDDSLGLVFPADPHLSDWDGNLEMATDLAKTMGIEGPLPPFFDFPIGTMFWARREALKPLLDLSLGWDDYPDEPVPKDGTVLHALERLLPFAASAAGYRFAATSVPGVTW